MSDPTYHRPGDYTAQPPFAPNPWGVSAPSPDDPSPRIVRPIPASDLHAIFTPRTRRAIEARLQAVRHVRIESARPSLIGWLGDTYGTPRGLLWFAGTLAPIMVAAFCLGYFGFRELLAVVS